MRLNIYKQINEMLNTFMEAINYIKNSNNEEINRKLIEDSKLMLNSIDSVLTQNIGSIKDLRVFEQLKKCSKMIDDLLKTNASKDIKALNILDDCAKNLQILFLNYVQYKIHVVFFAELGQKWDAMNSVYEAFENREDCDVKVVLTPIFRKVKLNGETKTNVIYEDYLTELGINFLHFKEYDISKHLPDMAFISNPYESTTLKDFWPENIAKFSKLVYLPYFTAVSYDEKLTYSIARMPVSRYSWRIIIQSNELKRMYEQTFNNKKENVLVSELPKWDELFKVINGKIKKDDKLKSISKTKKVFLWNTHYTIGSNKSTLLTYGQKILNHFKERDDVFLIWRPHPMTETIFEMYTPEYLPLWKEMKEIAENTNNISIDNNPSYKNSLYFSAALISDYSSLIAEYLFVRKPILFLKDEKTENFLKNRKFLIPLNKLEQANSFEDIKNFINKITKNNQFQERFKKEIKKDIPMLDGKIGERLATTLIEQLIEETMVNEPY